MLDMMMNRILELNVSLVILILIGRIFIQAAQAIFIKTKCNFSTNMKSFKMLFFAFLFTKVLIKLHFTK